jgi:mannose-6-phosphate isomerase
MNQIYPIKFHPILKQKVWGGNKLNSVLGKPTDVGTGESWEISGVSDNISVVSNGEYKSKTLEELIALDPEFLLGNSVYSEYGSTFPLLFKFIDAAQDLSVQLHPDDLLAKERHNSFGKTEMWYIIQAEADSRLILGFNGVMDQTTYLKYLSEKNLISILNEKKVQKGDAFFIGPGTVHAIGGGILLAEIQQTSDITYRIYDWDRPDTDGKMRELHTEKALDAINFESFDGYLSYSDKTNTPIPICTTRFFQTNKLTLDAPLIRILQDIDSFVVYMCLEGDGTVEINNSAVSIKKGETVLIPAKTDSVTFKTENATFLEVYIP